MKSRAHGGELQARGCSAGADADADNPVASLDEPVEIAAEGKAKGVERVRKGVQGEGGGGIGPFKDALSRDESALLVS